MMFVTDYKNDILSEITAMRRELLEINTETNHGVYYVKSKMLAMEPLVEDLKGVCLATVDRCNKNDAKVEDFL